MCGKVTPVMLHGVLSPEREERASEEEREEREREREGGGRKRVRGTPRSEWCEKVKLQGYLADKKRHPLRSYRRPMPRVLGKSQEGGLTPLGPHSLSSLEEDRGALQRK